jgi:TatD DNase family protein
MTIFQNMQYIDFHTHHLKEENNIRIRNVFAQDLISFSPEYLFSAGLHPWHIDVVNLDDCFRSIEQSTLMKNMLAVGECGLDRSITTDFALQEKCFRIQIEIAEIHSKPLIIHCVRAYSDLIKIKNETKSKVPWIIHGFQGNQQITQSLIGHGFYFSVGEKLLKTNSKHEVFKSIPLNRLFLETDDHEISIDRLYKLAADILLIDQEKLSQAIFNNFETLFESSNLKKS